MTSWELFIHNQQEASYYKDINTQLAHKRALGETIYPPEKHVFDAFKHCSLEQVKVVILGQDPYHGANQAHGLSFSVSEGVAIPPSLRNIYKELARSIPDYIAPTHGCLEYWAKQGVLLLNTVLTVGEGKAHSHADIGWQIFTQAALDEVAKHNEHVVFILWGAHAQQFASNLTFLNHKRHLILKAPHPSPLSAHRGFFGCNHFVLANEWLCKKHHTPIDWQV